MNVKQRRGLTIKQIIFNYEIRLNRTSPDGWRLLTRLSHAIMIVVTVKLTIVNKEFYFATTHD